MNQNDSAFVHFGILPSVCIHSVDEDQYSKMYIPNESCYECGGSEWIDGICFIGKNDELFGFPPKNVHRCKSCDGIRLATHIGAKGEIIQMIVPPEPDTIIKWRLEQDLKLISELSGISSDLLGEYNEPTSNT